MTRALSLSHHIPGAGRAPARYHKKKYVWKLVYIFVLGYDVDCGHMEAISLMMSAK